MTQDKYDFEKLEEWYKEYLKTCWFKFEELIKSETDRWTSYNHIWDINLPSEVWYAIFIRDNWYRETFSRETINKRKKDPEKPEFTKLMQDLKDKQQQALVNLWLSWRANPVITKLLLSVNHQMHEKTVVENQWATINENELED